MFAQSVAQAFLSSLQPVTDVSVTNVFSQLLGAEIPRLPSSRSPPNRVQHRRPKEVVPRLPPGSPLYLVSR